MRGWLILIAGAVLFTLALASLSQIKAVGLSLGVSVVALLLSEILVGWTVVQILPLVPLSAGRLFNFLGAAILAMVAVNLVDWETLTLGQRLITVYIAPFGLALIILWWYHLARSRSSTP